MRDRVTAATCDWWRCSCGAGATDGRCVVRAAKAHVMWPSRRLAVAGSWQQRATAKLDFHQRLQQV